jgi:hypothetical protein
MTPDERRHGTSKSGWCIDGHHEGCTLAGCPCECHNRANVVESQGCSTYNGSSKTAPGVASTNTEGLARSSGTSREGMAHMVATSDPARTPQGEVSCARQV